MKREYRPTGRFWYKVMAHDKWAGRPMVQTTIALTPPEAANPRLRPGEWLEKNGEETVFVGMADEWVVFVDHAAGEAFVVKNPDRLSSGHASAYYWYDSEAEASKCAAKFDLGPKRR